MKIITIVEEEESKKPGTYVGAKFTTDTVARLKKFAKDNEIPNYLESSKYHTTIIYSRKHVPDLKVDSNPDPKWVGKPEKLEIFKTQSGTDALVLRYSCPEQKKLHEHIMKTTDATYDFDEYKIHVTLSYDIEDIDQDKLKSLSLSTIGDIIISKVYVEDLKLDWADSTKKSKD